jgi:hypothetical protein
VRTTVDLDEDTARAIETHRRERGVGLSEAVNELIRQGLLPRARVIPFRQRTQTIGIAIDVSNVAEALDTLEGPKAR